MHNGNSRESDVRRTNGGMVVDLLGENVLAFADLRRIDWWWVGHTSFANRVEGKV